MGKPCIQIITYQLEAMFWIDIIISYRLYPFRHIYDNAKNTVAEAIRVYKALGLDEQNGTEFEELKEMQTILADIP